MKLHVIYIGAKLKELSSLLIFYENKLILSQNGLRVHEKVPLAGTMSTDEMVN